MAKFIDVEDQNYPDKPRNLINTKHIVRIQRLAPMNENSPVLIILSNGDKIKSDTPYKKFIELLEGQGI